MSAQQNATVQVEGNELIIRVDLSQDHGLSSSGKSHLISAATKKIKDGEFEGIKVGINVYRPV